MVEPVRLSPASSRPDACPRSHRPRLAAALLVAAALAVAGGCASTSPEPPQTMRDPQADFTRYRTFGWHATPAAASDSAPLALFDSQVRTALAQELTRRGYTEAPADAVPDLRIVFETESAEKLRNSPVRVGVGVGSWGGNVGGSVNVGTSGVQTTREGTIVVHAIDTSRNAEVWEGRATQTLTKKTSGDPAAIARAVATVMREFPGK